MSLHLSQWLTCEQSSKAQLCQAQATFTTPSTLVLSIVSQTAATFETGGRAGASPLDVFTSTAPGAALANRSPCSSSTAPDESK